MPEEHTCQSNVDVSGDWKPRPDPTVLTTQQLAREIANVKELITGRLDRMDKAQELFENNLTRVPTEVQRAVGTLEALHSVRFDQVYTSIAALALLVDTKFDANEHSRSEKFLRVDDQFALRDKAVKETADLTGLALTAALAAAEKSAQRQTDWFSASQSKLEATFTKQQDQLAETVKTLNNTLSDKVNTVKESLTLISGSSSGRSAMWGWVVAGAGLVFSGIAIIVAIAVYLSHISPVSAVAPIVIPK